MLIFDSGLWGSIYPTLTRGYGEVIGAPPDERGGDRQTQHTATAPHLDTAMSKRKAG